MKIELEEPFKSKWKTAYLRTRKDNRKIIDLVNSDNDRTSISYARYKMGVKLGYEVSNDLEVDHDDNDKTNDASCNLRLLTQKDNIQKEKDRAAEEQIFHGFQCAVCDEHFVLTTQVLNMRLKQTTTGLAYCSKSCSAANNAPTKDLLTEQEKIEIKTLRSNGLSSYKISDLTGKARNTVMKYW